VVIVVGRANLAETSAATIAAFDAARQAAPGATTLTAFRRGNVVGALRVGMRPGDGGLDTRGILQAAADGKIGCLVLLGADPMTDFPDSDLVRRAFDATPRIVAVDSFLTSSSEKADVVLAASMFAEKAGTTTNLEGRVTAVAREVNPAGNSRADWMIAAELALELGSDLGFATVGDITAAISAGVSGFDGVTAESVVGDGVLAGVPADLAPVDVPAPSVPDRNAYDFRLVVSRLMYDQAITTVNSPTLAPLAPEGAVHLHPLDLERVGTTEGRDVKLSSTRTSVIFRAVADSAVLRGTAWVPFNQPGPNVGELIDCFAAVNDVRIETI
jgi:predicted molibdopterin-dependent oxidoreductase YjgC